MIRVLIMFLLMSAAAIALEDVPVVMIPAATLFEYEKQTPLHPIVTVLEDRPQSTRYHVEYSSTNGLRVSGYYYVPKNGRAPYPCVIFMHGGGGSKDDLAIGYELMVMRGFAVLAIDAALHGERETDYIKPDRTDWHQTRNIYIQTVVDLRRAVDWLETRPEIDPARIGYFGASQGAIVGVVFTAVEKRIACAFFLVGGADFRLIFRHSQIPSLSMLRNYATDAEINMIADDMAAVDPQHYISSISPRPIFLMNGKKDMLISPEAGTKLQELASEPKETVWYDGTHLPPFDKVMFYALKFYKKHLGTRPPQPNATAQQAEPPSIRFNIDRSNSTPGRRIITVTANTGEPLPPGAKLAINFPEISPRNFPLFDDGTHGDAAPGDGIWSFRFNLGARPPDLELVGGDKLYACSIVALSSDGDVLSSVDAGWLTAEKIVIVEEPLKKKLKKPANEGCECRNPGEIMLNSP
ncbi:MAG: acetylxylan esterase [bacterium]